MKNALKKIISLLLLVTIFIQSSSLAYASSFYDRYSSNIMAENADLGTQIAEWLDANDPQPNNGYIELW